jgi:hypothetical protein
MRQQAAGDRFPRCSVSRIAFPKAVTRVINTLWRPLLRDNREIRIRENARQKLAQRKAGGFVDEFAPNRGHYVPDHREHIFPAVCRPFLDDRIDDVGEAAAGPGHLRHMGVDRMKPFGRMWVPSQNPSPRTPVCGLVRCIPDGPGRVQDGRRPVNEPAEPTAGTIHRLEILGSLGKLREVQEGRLAECLLDPAAQLRVDGII